MPNWLNLELRVRGALALPSAAWSWRRLRFHQQRAFQPASTTATAAPGAGSAIPLSHASLHLRLASPPTGKTSTVQHSTFQLALPSVNLRLRVERPCGEGLLRQWSSCPGRSMYVHDEKIYMMLTANSTYAEYYPARAREGLNRGRSSFKTGRSRLSYRSSFRHIHAISSLAEIWVELCQEVPSGLQRTHRTL